MKIVKQLLKEFWLPLILSGCWVAYNVYSSESSAWPLQRVVNVFGPTFFLLSWLIGQVFRVKKQVRVEDSFSTIEKKLRDLLDEFERKTKDTIAHVTGGDSCVYFGIGVLNHAANCGRLMATHIGQHPLYDVAARFVDLQKFKEVASTFTLESMQYTDTNIPLGNIIPSHTTMLHEWPLGPGPEKSYNIFITARNGSFVQMLRLKKINGVWVSATRLADTRHISERPVLHEQVDEAFPRDAVGAVDWS